MAGEKYDDLPVAGDDGLFFSRRDRARDVSRGRRRVHLQPVRDAIGGSLVKHSLVIDVTDLRLDESGRDVRDLDSVEGELRRERLGERAYRELAHAVRCVSGKRDEAVHAADESERSARLL